MASLLEVSVVLGNGQASLAIDWVLNFLARVSNFLAKLNSHHPEGLYTVRHQI